MVNWLKTKNEGILIRFLFSAIGFPGFFLALQIRLHDGFKKSILGFLVQGSASKQGHVLLQENIQFLSCLWSQPFPSFLNVGSFFYTVFWVSDLIIEQIVYGYLKSRSQLSGDISTRLGVRRFVCSNGTF